MVHKHVRLDYVFKLGVPDHLLIQAEVLPLGIQ